MFWLHLWGNTLVLGEGRPLSAFWRKPPGKAECWHSSSQSPASEAVLQICLVARSSYSPWRPLHNLPVLLSALIPSSFLHSQTRIYFMERKGKNPDAISLMFPAMCIRFWTCLPLPFSSLGPVPPSPLPPTWEHWHYSFSFIVTCFTSFGPPH